MNAMLVNIEARNNVFVKDTNVFTKLDHYLWKKFVGSHSKAPTELIHLVKKDYELTKRVYGCQIMNPSKGDWCK